MPPRTCTRLAFCKLVNLMAKDSEIVAADRRKLRSKIQLKGFASWPGLLTLAFSIVLLQA